MTVVTNKDNTQVADFSFGFTLGEKAVVTEEDDGHIYIEGLASDFGLDRQEEAFEPGAFEQGLKAYMDSNPILLYHHKSDTALGQVVNANLSSEGLHVKARVDAPEPGTMIADYVRKIKNGTLRAFSVGGKFYRRMTDKGPRIFKCDIGEVSVTPYPVNPRTLFAIAGKAFESAPEIEEIDVSDFDERLERIDAAFAEHEGKAKKTKTSPAAAAASGSQAAAIKASQAAGRGHPDAAPVAELLMHQQKIHTLATNTAQNAADPEVAAVAAKAAASARKHSEALHHIAARIGPLPSYYSPLA